ncbi:hypothetical protein GLYMA_02G014732v4 [Glycine max]|nr:hypothetical protein GLYMA_02G014732v4 [Glycine max]
MKPTISSLPFVLIIILEASDTQANYYTGFSPNNGDEIVGRKMSCEVDGVAEDLLLSMILIHQNEDTISICPLPSNHTDTHTPSLPSLSFFMFVSS